jgi:hypothetical protein
LVALQISFEREQAIDEVILDQIKTVEGADMKVLSRNLSQKCSTGFSSSEYGGKLSRRVLSVIGIDWFLCQLASPIAMKILSSGQRAGPFHFCNILFGQSQLAFWI